MQLSNPAPLALFGFAMPTILFSLMNAGVYNANAALIGLVCCYGGLAQLVVGILMFFKGNTFGLVVFFSYGAFWWSVAFDFLLPTVISAYPAGQGNFMGAFMLLWGIFTFFCWICTFKHSRVAQAVFLTLWLTFIMLSIGNWRGFYGFDTIGSQNSVIAGGWLGVICGCLAFYLGLSEVVNETTGYVLLPIGDYKTDETLFLDNWRIHAFGGQVRPHAPAVTDIDMAKPYHQDEVPSLENIAISAKLQGIYPSTESAASSIRPRTGQEAKIDIVTVK